MNPRIAALQVLRDCLADDDGPEPTAVLRGRIRSGRLPWEAVVGLANQHLLTPALWVALRRKGLDGELPGELHNYLRELHQLSTERNQHLRGQLLEAVEQLNKIDVVPILLKGSMHLVTDMYGDPGVRIMSDIDLLVPSEDVDRCMSALQALGYCTDEEEWHDYPPDHHQCPALSRHGGYGPLEIHRRLMGGCAQILSTEAAFSAARPLVFRGLRMKVLSPSHRILHNILHSQIVDRNYSEGVLPLRSLFETKVESMAGGEEVDWSTIQMLMESDHRGKVFRTYCVMAHRLFHMPLPEGLNSTIGPALYYWRCCGQLGWRWVRVWGRRYGRFSRDNMRETYGCGHGWIPVNKARLKHARRVLTSFAKRHISGVREDNR